MTDLASIRLRGIYLVESHQGIKGIELKIKLMSEFPSIPTNEIEQAISELVQARMIIRIEYQLKENRSTFFTFYLPEGSKVV